MGRFPPGETDFNNNIGNRMKKLLFLSMFCLFSFHFPSHAEEIVNFWKTVDEKTHQAQSIIAIYPYEGKYFGRIILTFDDDGKSKDTIYHPVDKAPGVVGNPYYSGLDIIWNLEKEGDKYTNGKILDPQKGKVYNAEAWLEGDDLIVRGELLIFGRNQTWPRAQESDFPSDFKKPDLSSITPKIPEPLKVKSDAKKNKGDD